MTGSSHYKFGTLLGKRGFRVLVLLSIEVQIVVCLFMMSITLNRSILSTIGTTSFLSRLALGILRHSRSYCLVTRLTLMEEIAEWYLRRKLENGVVKRETYSISRRLLKKITMSMTPSCASQNLPWRMSESKIYISRGFQRLVLSLSKEEDVLAEETTLSSLDLLCIDLVIHEISSDLFATVNEVAKKLSIKCVNNLKSCEKILLCVSG